MKKEYYNIKLLKKGGNTMNQVIEKALRLKSQSQIILLLYQKKSKLCASELVELLNSSSSSISNIVKKMQNNGLLNYQVRRKYHFFSLTKEVKDYLQVYHPEIISLKEEVIEDSHIFNESELQKYYVKAIELLKSPYYTQFLNDYSLKEALILSFNIVCYLNNKSFNITDIAMFFKVSETECRSMYRKSLLVLKERLNMVLDELVNSSYEENKNIK